MFGLPALDGFEDRMGFLAHGAPTQERARLQITSTGLC
jgi:hypothetical protein